MADFVFDIDGVLRDLNKAVSDKYGEGERFTSWSQKIRGQGLIDFVNMDKSILAKAPPTKYLEVIKEFYPKPTLWTHQLTHWVPYTLRWLDNYFEDFDIVVMEGALKYAELHKIPNLFLVEDSPKLPGYDRIVLIDQPYNRHIEAPIRISTASQLRQFIKENR